MQYKKVYTEYHGGVTQEGASTLFFLFFFKEEMGKIAKDGLGLEK